MTPAPAHHLAALRDRLGLNDPAPTVTFDNGSVVTVERKLVVEGYLGAVTRFAAEDLQRVYEMAMRGHQPQSPAAQPPEVAERFGDEAPWDDADLDLPGGNGFVVGPQRLQTGRSHSADECEPNRAPELFEAGNAAPHGPHGAPGPHGATDG